VQQQRYPFYLHVGGRSTALPNAASAYTPYLYPNPTQGLVWLHLPEATQYKVSLWDPVGRLLKQVGLPGGGYPQPLSLGLPAGAYLLRVETPRHIHLLRLLVE
jgi:hypothetical protein